MSKEQDGLEAKYTLNPGGMPGIETQESNSLIKFKSTNIQSSEFG